MEYYKNLDLKDIIYINDEGLVCWEEWRDIPGYEGIYQVSDLGRIKSLSRDVLRNGKYYYTSKEKIRTCHICNKGYLAIGLYKNKKTKTRKVHQFVAMAFLGHKPCGHKLVVNHKNFIRTDPRLVNLEVITARENTNFKHIQRSSKFTGVCWNKLSNKWTAQIVVNGKSKHLGYFDDELEASQYYENALIAIQNGTEIQVKHTIFTSIYKGVSLDKRWGRWNSSITIDKVVKYIGRFSTELEAHEARENYIKETKTEEK